MSASEPPAAPLGTPAAAGPIILPHRGIWPRIASDAFIAPGAVVIGDVEIGARTSVWFGCVLRGDVHHIRIGARTNIQDGTIVHVTGGHLGTIIGDDITIGHRALLHACTLESNCFVGMGAIVMDGAVVESWAMVAAGALVTPGKRVESRSLWAGSPAARKRDLSAEDIAFFPESARKYADLADIYVKEM
ncbi:gamma carbonic anhydrase family protein [Rhodospirillum rubrum]|uniref:gamma carbonic anhydrase family protein n=1 Tax=Rhodospirillum rubrum TaxID=1085 RepID=UPI001905C0B7|nr:gamma carbonic anhydrase family protein [Rhodospirillum rubrum]MBK1663776.1 gamma carbonic anhydrase family protein [Rhodospirillum rubrum]MBK1677707.1 gamma carbonic anhydrase family protein [Rhodospirillum rubrum]